MCTGMERSEGVFVNADPQFLMIGLLQAHVVHFHAFSTLAVGSFCQCELGLVMRFIAQAPSWSKKWIKFGAQMGDVLWPGRMC